MLRGAKSRHAGVVSVVKEIAIVAVRRLDITSPHYTQAGREMWLEIATPLSVVSSVQVLGKVEPRWAFCVGSGGKGKFD